MYRIELLPIARKQLSAIASPDRERIRRHIDALAENPHPPGSLKLTGIEDRFRIRVGDYRIIYQVRRAVLLVLVIRIGHRREIYR